MDFDSPVASCSASHESLGPQISAGLSLRECANTMALVSRCNPNPPEKCHRSICAYLRDAQQFAYMSFPNAGCNLADTVAKLASNVAVWRSRLANDLFLTGYLSRKGYKN